VLRERPGSEGSSDCHFGAPTRESGLRSLSRGLSSSRPRWCSTRQCFPPAFRSRHRGLPRGRNGTRVAGSRPLHAAAPLIRPTRSTPAPWSRSWRRRTSVPGTVTPTDTLCRKRTAAPPDRPGQRPRCRRCRRRCRSRRGRSAWVAHHQDNPSGGFGAVTQTSAWWARCRRAARPCPVSHR
jgi:hypothetical protein